MCLLRPSGENGRRQVKRTPVRLPVRGGQTVEATRYELLGPLQIRNEKPVRISAPKVEILLAALLIRANRPVSAEELISEIWGDDRPSRVRAGLHVYISQL
ncbi:winged helix-turn-helix domain-containing protein, partial [Frankia sp. AvcI1]|uniref:AfsR/SARP family transcriptional regulator n=1 Tax=Frankia sp. AvcI1 TaxID=573496 RepID=UPI001F2DEA5A